MPRTLTDEDGNEVEVTTEEEQKALEDKAGKVEDLEKSAEELKGFTDSLELKEGQSVADKIQEMKDDGNPDWKNMRAKNASLEKALKDSGKDIDDEGNIIEKEDKLSTEDLEKKITEGATKVNINNQIDTELLKFKDEDQRKVVKHYFDKLASGEDMTAEKVDKFMKEASQLAIPEGETNPLHTIVNVSGTAPRSPSGDKTNFADTDAGKGLAKSLGMGFAQPKKEDKK